jgi:hypothetical protein
MNSQVGEPRSGRASSTAPEPESCSE